MPAFNASDLRRVLANRHRCLAFLLDDPKHKPDIEEHLDVSRSTINYAIRELLELGLVDRSSGGFQATEFGRLVYATFEWYDRTLATECKAFDALAELPAGSIDSPALFHNASVVLPEPTALDRPLLTYLDLVSEADTFQGILPVVLEPCVETFHDRVVNNGLPTEIVTTQKVLQHLATTYVDRFTDMLGTNHCYIYEATGNPPFSISLLERNSESRIAVVIHDDSGVSGFISNEAREAVEWGETTYERYKRDAQHVFTRSPTVTPP